MPLHVSVFNEFVPVSRHVKATGNGLEEERKFLTVESARKMQGGIVTVVPVAFFGSKPSSIRSVFLVFFPSKPSI